MQRRSFNVIVGCMVVAAVATWAIWTSEVSRKDTPAKGVAANQAEISSVSNRPIVVHEDGFIGSASCSECHKREYEKWFGSYHRTMTQIATPAAVVGTFDGTEVELDNKQYRFHRDGDEFRVTISDLNAKGRPPEDKPFVMTTGSHHFQAYWLPSGNTRALDVFPMLFRIEDRRWIPLAAQFLHPPGFEHDFNRPGAWNITCNRCHATQAKPRIQDSKNMDTYVAEFGISCESCHGPAGQHVRNVKDSSDDLAIVQPESLTPAQSAQVCGSCHGSTDFKTDDDFKYWVQHGWPYRPGDDLFEHRSVVDAGDKQFWADGMLRVSGREYNGLMATPCFQHDDPARQMTCLSCHQMHQGVDDPRPVKEWANDQLKCAMDSNHPGQNNDQACTQCHSEFIGDNALTGHTHHAATSPGSRCYNCHMPHTTWGVMKAMRSHTISSPNVAESLDPVGRPNACNLCHLNETLAWTAENLQQNYGHTIPELVSDEASVAASILWALQGDAGQRAIVAWNMGWGPAREISGDGWMVPFLAQLLEDPYHVVRSTAYRSLKKVDGFDSLKYDFVGPAKQRTAARDAAMRIWQEQREESAGTPDAATLMKGNGSLQQIVFDRLLGKRDNRPVFLEE